MEQKRRIYGELEGLYRKYGKQLRFPVYLGMRSAEEIMQAVMEYQYFLLSEEGRIRYLRRVEELNA